MFRFEPLGRGDLPMLRSWLEAPHVARWWCHDTSEAGLERDFGPSIDGDDPALLFIAHLDERPIGFIQWYRLADEPEYVAELTPFIDVGADDVSVDYFVGESDMAGQGVGPAMIAAFVEQRWAADPAAGAVIVPIHADNRPSWRAAEKAGFEFVTNADLKPDNPADSTAHVIYRRPGRGQVAPGT